MKDLHSNILIATAIGAAVLAADTDGAVIDLIDHNSAEIVLAIGAGGIAFSAANRIDFIVLHGDDAANLTPVSANDVLGAAGVDGGVVKSLKAAHAQAASYRFGYKGGKRYLKIVADFAGAHGTGTAIAALVIKAAGINRPEPHQA